VVAWINDDGVEHGDELERLRYLEAHSAALALVQHLVPIVGAVAVLLAGRGSAWPVFAVVVVPAVGLQFALWYLRGQGVRVATHWLRTSNSRRYSLAACYTLFLGSMVAVDALPITPQILVIVVGAQAVGFWASRNQALRQHDEVTGADTPAYPGKRRSPSMLWLVLAALNGILLAASLLLLSGEASASVLIPFAALFLLSASMYRRERRREQQVITQRRPVGG
jgi:hypothetical protein